MTDSRGTIIYGVEQITKLLEHLTDGRPSFEQADAAADLLTAFMRLQQEQRALLWLHAAGYADLELARMVWGTEQRWRARQRRTQALDALVDLMNGQVRTRKRGKRG